MKKFISLITLIALLITALAIFASCGMTASKEIETGKDDKISWSYDPTTKILTIDGDPTDPVAMNDYTQSGEGLAPWHKYRTTASTVHISGISKISANAFYSMFALTSVKFLDNALTEIGDYAFIFCSPLTTITLPENVTSIGVSAFEACGNLTSLKIPAKVTSIGERAFALNHKLTAISMEEEFSTKMTGEEFTKIFFGIPAPTLTRYNPNETDAENQAPTDSETSDASDNATESSTETAAPTNTDSADSKDDKPQSNLTTIIAIVVFAVVIIGIIVGIVLVMRSNSKQTKDSQTVRKNDSAKNNKNSKYNQNGKSKGKKK